jgi:hypothetical protein
MRTLSSLPAPPTHEHETDEDPGTCSFTGCNQKATWFYAPGTDGDRRCDKHVPRGCTCNQEPVDGDYDNEDPANWQEPTDELGRKYPCCEWYND